MALERQLLGAPHTSIEDSYLKENKHVSFDISELCMYVKHTIGLLNHF